MADNIFQPVLSEPDISAAGQRAVPSRVDTTTADIINLVGDIGVQGVKLATKSELRGKVQEDISGFFARGEQELETGVPLDVSLAAAERDAEDTLALSEGRAKVNKLKRLKESGAASGLELKARAEKDVKEFVNRFPGLADEFRSLYANELNAYAARIALIDNKRKQAFEVSENAKKQEDEYKEDVAKFHGIPTTSLTQKHVVDFQSHKAMDNRKKFTQNAVDLKKFRGQLALSDVEEDVQVTQSMDMIDLSASLNQGTYGSVDIAQLSLDGASTETILTQLFSNDLSKQQYTDGVKKKLNGLIVKTNQMYRDSAARLGGINQKDLESSRSAAIAPLEDMLASIEGDMKSGDGLKTFVDLLQSYNNGATAGFNVANPTFHLMTKTGLLTRDTMTRYAANPELFKADNPAMFKVLKKAETGLLSADFLNEQHTRAFLDPDEFDSYRNFNPEMGDYFIEIASEGINKLKVDGFSKEPKEALSQKEWATHYTKAMLTQVKEGNLNSYKAMESFFFDPNYLEVFSNLDDDQQTEIASIIFDKAGLITNSNISELNRIDLKENKDFDIEMVGNSLRATVKKHPVYGNIPKFGARANEIRKFQDNVNRLNKSLRTQWKMEMSRGNKVSFEEFATPLLEQINITNTGAE